MFERIGVLVVLAVELDHSAVAVDGRKAHVPALLGQAPVVDALGDGGAHHVDELAKVALGRRSGFPQGGIDCSPRTQAATGRQRRNELGPIHGARHSPAASVSFWPSVVTTTTCVP